MRFGLLHTLLFAVVCGLPASAQVLDPQAVTPPPTSADPNPARPGQEPSLLPPRPLTPLEERERQIRQVDPLDPGDAQKSGSSGAADKNRQPDSQPLPGSIADTQDRQSASRRSGPQVVDDTAENAPVQEYSGPAVLSRSYSINRPLIPEQAKWQETAGISSVYDTGVTRPAPAPGETQAASSTLIGTNVTWALRGRHYYHHDQIGVDYSGNYAHYGSGGFNGLNESIAVDWQHVLTRRLSLNLSGAGAVLSQNSVLQNQSAGADTIANVNLASSPNIEIYDTGVKQFSSAADLTWQKTTRLSFSIGTSYFGTKRDSPVLLGVTGEQARGDVNYRLTRKTTVGSYYSFSRYLYPHGAGDSDSHTVGLIYSYALSRSMQFRFRGGVTRLESLGQQTVAIAPDIAAILGVSSGIIDSYQKSNFSDFSAEFVKDFRRGSTLSFAYARGVSPGNGVFQTSQQESASANFGMKVFRTYSFQAGIGRDKLVSATQSLGIYQSEFARISLNRSYRRGVSWSFEMAYRYFDVIQFGGLHNQLRISSGITWNSGLGRLWPF